MLNSVNAQIINVDTLIKPISQPDAIFEEYLVQLAWQNNPGNKVFEREITIAENDVKLAKWAWTDDFIAQFNLNERNLVSQYDSITATVPPEFLPVGSPPIDFQVGTPGVTLFPRYNLTASIKLGTLFNNPKKTENARQKLEIGKHKRDQQKLEVRAAVLMAYYTYIESIEMLKIRTQAVEDSDASYKYIANLFKTGEAEFDQFNQAASNYHNSKEQQLQARSDTRLSKLELEMLIGMQLEKAKAYHENR